METSGLRHRRNTQEQNIIEIKETIYARTVSVVEYDCAIGQGKTYKTIKEGFLIKFMKHDIPCIFGRLVNNKIIPITAEEQKSLESVGYLVGDMVPI